MSLKCHSTIFSPLSLFLLCTSIIILFLFSFEDDDDDDDDDGCGDDDSRWQVDQGIMVAAVVARKNRVL